MARRLDELSPPARNRNVPSLRLSRIHFLLLFPGRFLRPQVRHVASDLAEGEAVELVLRDVGVLEEDAEDEVIRFDSG